MPVNSLALASPFLIVALFLHLAAQSEYNGQWGPELMGNVATEAKSILFRVVVLCKDKKKVKK